MPIVRKQLLAPGTYWINGRLIEFTSADIRDVWRRSRAMIRAGVAVPVPLEHQDDAKPISMSERAARSVTHNAGWVHDLPLLNGTMFVDLDIPDAEFAKKLPTHVKFVSPEIDPDFTDGAGRHWGPVVTHVALTTKPVWSGQQPFGGDGASLAEPSLPGTSSRFSRNVGSCRFSMAAAVRRESRGWWPRDPVAFGWTAYQGPRGGKGWKNDETGKVVYGATKPSDGKASKASPEEKAKLDAAKEGRKEQRRAGGPVDHHALRREMAETAKKHGGFGGRLADNPYLQSYANRSYKQILDHHGDLFLQRVREIANADMKALAEGLEYAPNGRLLTDRLAVANYWMTRYGREHPGSLDDARGVDGGGAGGTPFNEIVTARAELTDAADTGVVPQSLHRHLNEVQIQGAAKAIAAMDSHGGFLLADGPGTGKTRQALAVAKTYADRGKKVLLVAPVGIVRDEKGGIVGSVGKDAATMGVQLTPNFKADQPIGAGQVHVTSYEQLAKIKGQIDKDTIVIFDEAHGLKNSGSIRSKQGREIASQAGGVMLATATPADRTSDLAYTFRAHLEPPPIDETIKQLDPDKVGAAEAYKRTAEVFSRLTKAGAMVKREISLKNVEVNFDQVDLPPEAHEAMKAVANAAGTKGRAQALMKQRRLQEQFKIPAATSAVQAELAEGRQVVLYVAGVSGDDDGSGEQGEGTAGKMRQALIAAGVPAEHIAELHGGEAGGGADAVKGFQAGQHKILITTAQSGGTGHNLDDVTGSTPRTQIVMTAPFSAIENAQMWGRTHRLTTKSKSRMRYLFANTDVDQWNRSLISDKVGTLEAIVGGEAGKQRFTDAGTDAESPVRASRFDSRNRNFVESSPKRFSKGVSPMAEQNQDPDDLFTEEELGGGEETESPAGVGNLAGLELTTRVAEVLSQHGFVVEPEEDCESFLRHVITAAATAAAGGAGGNAPPPPPGESTEQPMTLAMSRRVQTLESELADTRLEKRKAEIDTLVKEGRVKPATAQAWIKALTTHRMSLVTNDGKEVGAIDFAIALAKETPKGAFWSDEQKAAQFSNHKVEDAPEWGGDNKKFDQSSPEFARIVDSITGGRYTEQLKRNGNK